jgi:SAM-dependent methyltransferase
MNVESISDALRFDPETGVWCANAAGPVSYPPDHDATCFRVEDGSFWFNHRNRCITAAVRRFQPEGFILDVGGGNGFVARGLVDAGYETVLLEPGRVGARNARSGRALPTVINATIGDAAIRTASVPNVGLFDVLEHIEDHQSFVDHLSRILRPGGFLFLTVPAFDWLWSVSDVDAMHYRRYTRQSLTKLLAGRFDVLYATYLFQRLVPLFVLARALPYRVGLARARPAHAYEADHGAGRPWTSAALERLLASEVSAIVSGTSLRMGSSLLVVARRRDHRSR